VKKEFNHFPLYEFSGTEREIGRQYGEECKEMIKNSVSYWAESLTMVTGKTLADFIAAIKPFDAPLKDNCPDFYEEIVGIAEGSGLGFDEVLFINTAFELDVGFPVFLAGCTSFACSGATTVDGKTLVGQNVDWGPGVDGIILRVKPQNGPAYLTFTLAGSPALMGINENGLSLFANLLVSPVVKTAVPMLATVHKALQQKNVPDQIRAISQTPRSMALNYLFAGKDGEIIDIESTPDKCGMLLPDRDILTHANHFTKSYLEPEDLADQTAFPDTFLRQYRLKELMEAKRGELSVEVMMELLQDHRGYPDSICRHCDTGSPRFEWFETLASLIAVPGDGRMYATANPCLNPYKLYTL